MFFFEEKAEVKFKVRKRVRDNFNMALAQLNKSEEEAFEEFTSDLISQALKKTQSKAKDIGIDIRMSDTCIAKRIRKWSANPKCLPFKMLKAYLTILKEYSLDITEYTDRIKLIGVFMSMSDCDQMKAQTLFRQMCTNASHSYGDVFVYERSTKNVYLNEKYIAVIRPLVDKFLE